MGHLTLEMRMHNVYLTKSTSPRCPNQDPVSCHLTNLGQLEISAISRGTPLQGTDFILTQLDAELTKLTREMNSKWKIKVLDHFWLFLAIFGKMAGFLKKRSTQDKNSR